MEQNTRELSPGNRMELPMGTASSIRIDKTNQTDDDSAMVEYGEDAPITVREFPYEKQDLVETVAVTNTGAGELTITFSV